MAEIWGREYWANTGGVKLYMFRKRLGPPIPGEAPRPVFFLVHGSSFGTQSGVNLTVQGQDYSMMNWFARPGFDVWGAGSREGYSRSSRTDGNSDIASGVEDLRAGMHVVERETGLTQYMFYGQSSGPSGRPRSPRPAPSGWLGWCWMPSCGRGRTRRRSSSGART